MGGSLTQGLPSLSEGILGRSTEGICLCEDSHGSDVLTRDHWWTLGTIGEETSLRSMVSLTRLLEINFPF